jgi:hypothetical protein
MKRFVPLVLSALCSVVLVTVSVRRVRRLTV